MLRIGGSQRRNRNHQQRQKNISSMVFHGCLSRARLVSAVCRHDNKQTQTTQRVWSVAARPIHQRIRRCLPGCWSISSFLSFGRVARPRPRCQSIHLLPEQKRNIGFDQNRRRTSRFILRGRIRCSFFVVCFTWPSRRYIARNKESNRTERCVGARAAHPSGRGINGTTMVSRPCCHGANRFR